MMTTMCTTIVQALAKLLNTNQTKRSQNIKRALFITKSVYLWYNRTHVKHLLEGVWTEYWPHPFALKKRTSLQMPEEELGVGLKWASHKWYSSLSMWVRYVDDKRHEGTQRIVHL